MDIKTGQAVTYHPIAPEPPLHAVVQAVHNHPAGSYVKLSVCIKQGYTYEMDKVALVAPGETPPEFSPWCELADPAAALPVSEPIGDGVGPYPNRLSSLHPARVTPAQIDALMAAMVYKTQQVPDTTTTFVHAFLNGYFHVATGVSACVDASAFDAQIGQQLATEDALKKARAKLWELEGYRLYSGPWLV